MTGHVTAHYAPGLTPLAQIVYLELLYANQPQNSPLNTRLTHVLSLWCCSGLGVGGAALG